MPAFRIRVGFVVKPRMSGFADISRIPPRSAPSAKILIFSSSIAAIRLPFLRCRETASRSAPWNGARFRKDEIRGLGQRRGAPVGTHRHAFLGPVSDEDRAAAGRLPGENV